MKNILVTGAAGFIGANFAELMVKKYEGKYNIIVFDKLTYAGNIHNLDKVMNDINKFAVNNIRVVTLLKDNEVSSFNESRKSKIIPSPLWLKTGILFIIDISITLFLLFSSEITMLSFLKDILSPLFPTPTA